MSFYEKLDGGHLVPTYEILPSEAWTTATGTTGTAVVGVSPKFQGTHSLGITSAGAGSTVISSAMSADLTAFDGVAMVTYATAGTALIVVTERLLADPAGASTVSDVIFDHPYDHVAPATIGGQACIRLRLTGIAPAALTASTGCEAVVHGSSTGIDRTYTIESITAGPTASDSYVYVRDAGVTVTAGAASGRVRIYGDDAVYYKLSWAVSNAASAGIFAYGSALYDVALYGFDTPVSLDAWTIVKVPTADLLEINTPTWGSIAQVDLECFFAGAGTFYFDGVAGWVREAPEAASANRYVSNLPEYHFDQPFTDAFAQAVGYDLDVAAATVDAGLRQRVLPDASYDLALHEQALNLPQAPLLRSAAQRRDEMMGYMSMPATATEVTAALTLIMGAAVTIVENHDNLSLDVSFPTADATEQARLQRACGRLLPAHLGVAYNFTGATLKYGAREDGDLADTAATVT